ncbi:N-(5-amino-5-carboxypentanoyl)-L-cysteinyl-D-valine synthase [Madurella mycetomatis]|uniref:N-(5-amino-5-carboxypentanoyl)-L-cysteinyl-D-valine synthase n=1 Tax=Madurella mycetomatis TaxID=100816 RepID=A0A175WIC0_9PEZI|nr:N-(5-amino-5-carboxypentanoyl)-L-cysteinyl-D-valine synthase [Madurella mycetomatis]
MNQITKALTSDDEENLISVVPGELVKSQLVDLMVVFDDASGSAPLPEFPLVLRVVLEETHWKFSLRYASGLFGQTVIDSFLSALHTLLAATTEPSRPLGDIELLPAKQVDQLNQWNNTDGDYPSEKRLHHLFEEAVSRRGRNVALICGEKHVTYEALNSQANRLAHHLCSMGIQPEQLVGLFLDKSERMVATILGIWKSGAAYVPIDPAYPDERVRFVLDDTQVRIVITSERHVGRLRDRVTTERDLRVIALEPLLESLDQQRHQSPEEAHNLTHLPLHSKQLAYVTYTSGTTGFPKGIYKEHTSVVNSITDLSCRYGVAGVEDEVILLFSAYVFEPFVRQMLMALTTGNQLAIIGDEEKFDPDTLIPFIRKHKVSYINGTASVLQEYDFNACPSLKRMILVGENLTDARYEALRRRFKGRIFNEYGFTESAFVTALKVFEATSERKDTSLGRPVRNVKCYILDSGLKRVPIGVTGELHIGGLGISRGYMNREELTHQKFLPNPYQTERERERGVNGLMYKTGDLARWLPNGEVEYLGRADFQIKLRGIRIEPGEIESTLAMFPGIRTSIVVSRKLLSQGRETSQDHLVGYYVCDECAPSEDDLLLFLETKLPRYMIPTRLVQLRQIPVTINGKADLRALPAVEVAASSSSSPAGPAERRNKLDGTLASIWGDVLRIPSGSIGLESNFFRLGGHSIACIQLIARVRQQLGRGISLEEVFQTKTLRDMADLLVSKEPNAIYGMNGVANGTAAHLPKDAILNGHVGNSYLANSLQQGFVYHSLKRERSDAYIMQTMVHYQVPLDEKRYRSAWEIVQWQHPALRLRFAWEAEVMQIVDPEPNLDWRVVDWTVMRDEEARRSLLEQIQLDDRTRAYRLDEGPLIRLYFFLLPEERFSCLFSCHHAILDGWSLPLLFEYVHQAYLNLIDGTTQPIEEDTTYLLGQQYLQNHRDDHLDFWAAQIDKIEERCDMNALLNEASRYKVPLADYDQIREQRQQTIDLPWGKSMAPSVKQELDNRGITLHSVLQLVWHLVLHSYGGGTHTITGTTISGRHLPVDGIEHAVGLFINTLPLIFDHASCRDMTALEAITHVQSQVNAMNSKGNVELGRLQKNDLKHGLFDSLFVLENYPNLDMTQRKLHHERLKYTVEGGTEKLSYPLAVIAKEDDDRCSFTLCYASELFTDESIESLLHTVRDAFPKIAENIHAPIRDIEYISTNQVAQLNKWNATDFEYPNSTLHAIFESQAQEKPEKTAVVYEDVRLTYRELNSRANALAYHLLRKAPSIQPNTLVALVMDKSEHMITSILAIWKTGGAYVPIDPGYPDHRIQYILEDTAALAVIADSPHLDRLRGITQGRLPLIQSDLALHLPPSPVHPVSSCTPADLAYVMYTSGTTGRPKGVMVEHHGVVNLCVSLCQIFGLRDTDDEVILSFSNYVFDHFVEQMTDALLNGQTLVVLNDEMRGDKERLYKYIEANRVTYLSGTPSVISMYEFDRFHDHLRRIDCVGEAFSEPVFDKIRETFPGLIINGYGPTEVSITTHKRLYPFPERRTDKSIGRQVANSKSYVLNEDMKRVPIGAVGELYLGGDGVARGYHNRPDLVAERFPANPFQTEQEKLEGRNGRLYKTGDLVRWIQGADGEVEYLGRNDFQVKIRGQRIELGEIEAVLSSYPGIQQSVVVAKDRENDGQKYLVGYFVSAGSLSGQDIRRFMSTRLPDYMVPSRLVPIDKIPVTVSGKLDTKALPVPGDVVEEDMVAPRTEVEWTLAKIWSELLEIPVDSIGIYSNFFSLGGDSLKSTKLSFAATKVFGVSVSVSKLFSHPTIETLSHWIIRGSSECSRDRAVPRDDSLMDTQVSPAQERLIFLHEFDQNDHAYNVPFHLKLHEGVCLGAFEKALRDVVSRHEALRTLITRPHHNPRQCQRVLEPDSAQRLFIVEVLRLDSESQMQIKMAESTRYAFSLDTELPINVRLYQISTRGGSMLAYASIVFHHLAFDAWSWDIFKRDLGEFYSVHIGRKTTASLPTLRVQYKEYALEHRKALRDDQRRVLADYWLRKLSDLEPSYLVTDRPRPAQFDYAGNDLHVSTSQETTEQLKMLARREGTSLYTVVVAAYFLLLNLYTSQRDVTIGIPVAHRTHAEFESVIGFFVNLLPLRVNIAVSDVHGLIQAVQRELLDAQIHQDLPFQDITKLLHVQHDPSRHPLVQTVFNWETEFADKGTTPSERLVEEYCPSSPFPSVAKFDLNATVRESTSSLRINFNYATSLFDTQTIQGFLDTFHRLLRRIALSTPETTLSELSIEDRVLGELSNGVPTSNEAQQTLSEIFEAQAAATPGRIALADGHSSVSYFDANARANQLASWITSCVKIEADDRVALLLDKSIDMVIAILAVWKVGAAYVPLDPSYPLQRVEFILKDTSARMLITTRKHIQGARTVDGVYTMAIDDPGTVIGIQQQPKENVASSAPLPSNLAYVIFTSGTTGKPKGVLVEQRSVAQFRKALVQRYFGESNGSHAVLFLSNYVFDFSVEQLALSVLSGNKLIIPPEEGLTHEAFYHLADSEQLSYLSGTPSVLQQIQLSRLPHLRMVTAAGEEFHGSQFKSMRAQFKGPINNAYGITETTVYNIVTTFREDAPFTKALCDELPGTHVYVLNDRLARVPLNAVGELYLGGDCLARGYLNQEAMTRERFIPNPFNAHGQGSHGGVNRLYKTGDMVRFRGSHHLEYLGRRDQQIKLRGFRIELSEVRDAVLSIPGVKEAAVIPRYDRDEPGSRTINALICYYTLENGAICAPSDIRDHLSASLPPYMIPSQIYHLEGSLPVTVNGKLDTNRLTMTEDSKPESYSAPRNILEVKLCQLWASLLGMDHCGIDDDLFARGGDSISSLRLVGDIYRVLGRKVTVKDIYLHRTVRDLCENVLVGEEKENGKLPSPQAEQAQVEGYAPLLPIQRWFLSKPLQRPGYWNHCFTIRTPTLSVHRLREAVRLLQERHDVLRLRLKLGDDGDVVQIFPLNCTQPDVEEIDMTSFEEPDDAHQALSKLQSRFNIEEGPLYAVAYLHGYEDGSARVWFALHHLLVDTVSWNIILSDLQALYHGDNLGPKSSSVKQWALAVETYDMSLSERGYWNLAREKVAQSLLFLPNCAEDVFRCEERLSKGDTASLLMRSCPVLNADMREILLMAVGCAMQNVLLDKAPTVVTIEGHGREESIDSSLDVSRTVGWFTSMYPFEIPKVVDPAQGVVDVKESMRRVPNNGVGYGPAYGYVEQSLPVVSVNYLGRLDQAQPRSGDWTLALGPEEYPHGLCTGPEDAGRSSSMVDFTFAVTDEQLVIQMSCVWGVGASNELIRTVQKTLGALIEMTSRPDFYPPPPSDPDFDFTPYFVFEGASRRGAPLFLLPPGEGGAESYFHNIVQGLPHRNLVVFNNYYREKKRLSNIEDLASYYLAHIRSIQPEGPYHILGWSFGGILALEAAKRLTLDGERITTLALIDPYFDIPSAAKAIGQDDTHILDPIYHIYHPQPESFKPVQGCTDRLILFKATETNEKDGTPAQRALYEWFAACPMNNLDKFVARDVIQVVPLKGTHFSWVHLPEQIRSMCARLEE